MLNQTKKPQTNKEEKTPTASKPWNPNFFFVFSTNNLEVAEWVLLFMYKF